MQLVLTLASGGTERLVIDIATRLARSHQMVVCCLDDAGEWADQLKPFNIPVITLNRAPGFRPALGAKIAALGARFGTSIVHCHQYSPFVYGAIASLMDRRRMKVIFTEHGRLSDAPPRLKRRIANLGFSRIPNSVYAVSASLKQHMVGEGFSSSRVGVIYNGIEPGACPGFDEREQARRRLGISGDAFVVGTAARLDPVKDLGTLIAAISLVRQRIPSTKLVIVGEGEERAALESAVMAHGLAEHVHLSGYRADVRRLLPAFDVYVNSSISEGVSLTILEAMAAALPVVATNVGGTPEVVVDDATGILVEPRSPARLAAALEVLAGNPECRRRFGAAGRARVERMFTIDRMVGEYAREYACLGAR